MSSSAGPTLEERMAPTIDPFREELQRLEAERTKEIEAYRERMAAIESDIAKVTRVLKALGAEPKKTQKKRNTGDGVRLIGVRKTANGERPTGFGVTAERCLLWSEKIRAVADPTVTQKEIYQALDSEQGTASAVFKFLRSIEFIRKAGKQKGGADLWAVQDADAMERYMAGLKAQEEQQIDRLLAASLDSEDIIERVAAYIRENSPIVGWQAVAQAVGCPDHQANDIGMALADADLVKVTRRGGPGRRTLIEWVGSGLRAVAA